MRRGLASLALAAILAAFASPRAGAAQANECLLKESRQATGTVTGGFKTAYVSGPLYVQCTAGEELRADSAVIYEATHEVHLFGQVDYSDPTRALTSDYATYNSQTGRLYATGNVVFTDRERGSTLRGPELEYFRAMAGRPEAQMIATGRPHLTLVPRSEPGQARREPMEVDADRITTLGERFMTAEGNVVIRGKEMDATALQATYDSPAETLELRGNARVKGSRYDLTGNYVQTQLREGSIERVLSRDDAHLTSDKLKVDGPELRLFFARDSLQRMVSARGAASAPGRSIATATGFRMEADSLEAILPGQQLRTVVAVGTARGEAWDTAQAAPSPPLVAAPDTATARPGAARDSAAASDSATAEAARVLASVPQDRDLIFADTITGYFVQVDTTAAGRAAAAAVPAASPGDGARQAAARAVTAVPGIPGDTTRRAEPRTELDRMVATGNARSLYRLRDKQQQREGKPPGINYVTGDTIDLKFADGEVDVAYVRGLERGVYLDPTPPGQKSDTTAAATAASTPGGILPGSILPGSTPPVVPGPRTATPAAPSPAAPERTQRPAPAGSARP